MIHFPTIIVVLIKKIVFVRREGGRGRVLFGQSITVGMALVPLAANLQFADSANQIIQDVFDVHSGNSFAIGHATKVKKGI